VVRAQAYFNEEEYEAIREVAFRERISISALLRRLVDEQLLNRPRRKKNAAQWLLSMAGTIHDKPDVAQRHDDYLWGEEA
jgi:hypothetical protein